MTVFSFLMEEQLDDGSRPHVVTSLNHGGAFVYDSNGNIVDYGDRDVEWGSRSNLRRIFGQTAVVEVGYEIGAN